MSDRDRLAADLVDALPRVFDGSTGLDPRNVADRLLALGWTRTPLDLDGKPFCPGGSAQRFHRLGECECAQLDEGRLARQGQRIVSLLAVLPEQRERMQRYETGRNEERDDNYSIAATDRTVLIEQIDRIAKAYQEDET